MGSEQLLQPGLPPSTRPPARVLTTGPRVGSKGPVLQASQQVEGTVPQAEHGLQAGAPARRQALCTGVHAAVEQDAVGREMWGQLSLTEHRLQLPLPSCPTGGGGCETRPQLHLTGTVTRSLSQEGLRETPGTALKGVKRAVIRATQAKFESSCAFLHRRAPGCRASVPALK